MKFLLSINLLLYITISYAQNIQYKNYNWEKEPKIHELDSLGSLESEYLLKDFRAIEFSFDENDIFSEYLLRHKIIRVNSDDAIEYNNKVYIPLGTVSELITQKVRVINKSGTVKELDESNIKEAKDEESNSTYKYFAIEGLEKGSEIEYFYLLKKSPNYSGAKINFQSTIPRKDVGFEIIAPSNLRFKTKSYNGLPDMEIDTSLEDKFYLKLSIAAIPKVIKETEADYFSHMQYIIYKLDKNISKGLYDIVNYGSASENIYKNIYNNPPKSAIKKILKNIDLKSATTEKEKIRIIEDYIKDNYNIMDVSYPDLEDIEKITENKLANKRGIVRIYGNILKYLEIKHQIVLTSDRTNTPFDKDFESYNFLKEYLIYFPDSKTYLSPTNPNLRLGYIPANLMQNYGLFIKMVKLGDFETGIGKIKFIKPLSADKTHHDIYIDYTFNDDLSGGNMDFKNEYTGFYAEGFQHVYKFLKEEQQKKLKEALIESLIPNAAIKESTIENGEGKWFGKKPFTLSAILETNSFIDKAGNKFLFKVGLLIGPQVEMYQKEERKLPFESDYNRSFHHEIKFKIPEGYLIKDLSAINKDIFYSDEDGNRTMSFTSTYKQTGDEIMIIIDEYYTKMNYKVEEYEDYRRVINAAADFNKIVLVLESK